MSDRKTDIIKDYTNNQLVFRNSQQVGGILDQNRIDRNIGPQDTSFGRRFASVPIAVLDAWIQEGVDYRLIQVDLDMRKRFYAKLREFNQFLTYEGGIK
jgi:hypothetical protein